MASMAQTGTWRAWTPHRTRVQPHQSAWWILRLTTVYIGGQALVSGQELLASGLGVVNSDSAAEASGCFLELRIRSVTLHHTAVLRAPLLSTTGARSLHQVLIAKMPKLAMLASGVQLQRTPQVVCAGQNAPQSPARYSTGVPSSLQVFRSLRVRHEADQTYHGCSVQHIPYNIGHSTANSVPLVQASQEKSQLAADYEGIHLPSCTAKRVSTL